MQDISNTLNSDYEARTDELFRLSKVKKTGMAFVLSESIQASKDFNMYFVNLFQAETGYSLSCQVGWM